MYSLQVNLKTPVKEEIISILEKLKISANDNNLKIEQLPRVITIKSMNEHPNATIKTTYFQFLEAQITFEQNQDDKSNIIARLDIPTLEASGQFSVFKNITHQMTNHQAQIIIYQNNNDKIKRKYSIHLFPNDIVCRIRDTNQLIKAVPALNIDNNTMTFSPVQYPARRHEQNQAPLQFAIPPPPAPTPAPTVNSANFINMVHLLSQSLLRQQRPAPPAGVAPNLNPPPPMINATTGRAPAPASTRTHLPRPPAAAKNKTHQTPPPTSSQSTTAPSASATARTSPSGRRPIIPIITETPTITSTSSNEHDPNSKRQSVINTVTASPSASSTPQVTVTSPPILPIEAAANTIESMPVPVTPHITNLAAHKTVTINTNAEIIGNTNYENEEEIALYDDFGEPITPAGRDTIKTRRVLYDTGTPFFDATTHNTPNRSVNDDDEEEESIDPAEANKRMKEAMEKQLRVEDEFESEIREQEKDKETTEENSITKTPEFTDWRRTHDSSQSIASNSGDNDNETDNKEKLEKTLNILAKKKQTYESLAQLPSIHTFNNLLQTAAPEQMDTFLKKRCNGVQKTDLTAPFYAEIRQFLFMSGIMPQTPTAIELQLINNSLIRREIKYAMEGFKIESQKLHCAMLLLNAAAVLIARYKDNRVKLKDFIDQRKF